MEDKICEICQKIQESLCEYCNKCSNCCKCQDDEEGRLLDNLNESSEGSNN